MPTEADTCRTYVVPKLHTSGWDDEYIIEQMVLESLRELQSATGEELRPLFGRPLLPSVLDRAFKGEL